MANLTEALCAHFNESYLAALEWPWPLYCARWRRYIRYGHDRLVEQRTRDREQEEKREWADLKEAHRARNG